MVSSSTSKVYVITGASRGLGLGLVTGLLKQPDTVIVAAARNPSKAEALQKLAKEFGDRLHTVSLDTSSEESVQARRSLVPSLLGGMVAVGRARGHMLLTSRGKASGLAAARCLWTSTQLAFTRVGT